jgi:hypothetical protein
MEVAMKKLQRHAMSALVANGIRKFVVRAGTPEVNHTRSPSDTKGAVTIRKSPTLMEIKRVRSIRKSTTRMTSMILIRIMTNIKDTVSVSEATIPRRDLLGSVAGMARIVLDTVRDMILARADGSTVAITRKNQTLMKIKMVRSTRKNIASMKSMILIRVMTIIKHMASDSEATIPRRDLLGSVRAMVSLALSTVRDMILARVDETTETRAVTTIHAQRTTGMALRGKTTIEVNAGMVGSEENMASGTNMSAKSGQILMGRTAGMGMTMKMKSGVAIDMVMGVETTISGRQHLCWLT